MGVNADAKNLAHGFILRPSPLFRNVDAEAVIRTMARFAADPELSFSWQDALEYDRELGRMYG